VELTENLGKLLALNGVAVDQLDDKNAFKAVIRAMKVAKKLKQLRARG
jgi:hypothetical protein